jgi:heme/copper-type cytochrome/quinol oxidase subunit 4
MEPKKKTDPSKKKQLNDIGRYAGLGLQMMLTILALTALGNWADKNFNVQYPLFTLTGAVLGIATSMYWLFKSTSKN